MYFRCQTSSIFGMIGPMADKTIHVDIVIFGGGIAGLWALNRLRNHGYNAILLETHTLGGGQTIKSQGIIHGGLKYALGGFLNASANSIESMPKRWIESLRGVGEIDLRTVKVLSESQLLWSTGGLGSEIASFFASKALNSRVQKLKRAEYPAVLQQAKFKGHAYRLEEALAKPHRESIFKINPLQGYHFHFYEDNPQHIDFLTISSGQKTYRLEANRYLFAAGEGNAKLLTLFMDPPKMQCRPLQMVMVKLNAAYPFFAHCIDHGINPRITITTHPSADGKTIWYLGGQLAEDGVQRSKEEQINFAKKELHTLFPWLDFSQSQWGSFFVNRAEAKQPGGKRPETCSLQSFENVMIAWPTKLALSPFLSDEIIHLLEQEGISPSFATDDNIEFKGIEKPSIAITPWEEQLAQVELVEHVI